MEGYNAETFGALNAQGYDAQHDPGTTGAAVAVLAQLAGSGRVLEFAIGSGRIALPLAQLGIDIAGIEASAPMIDLLRAKPGGAAIEVVQGDMTQAQVAGGFGLVLLVFNTLFNVTSQDGQLACFANAARHLNKGGRFVVEAFVPDFEDFDGGQRTRTQSVDFGAVQLEAIRHDRARQVLDMQRITITPAGMRMVPLPMRYVYPPELDLMAQLNGFKLAERWGSWNKAPYDANSKMHVSVYEKTA
ncbi:MAG: class I SAM-dependent methyltransferase [Rhodobacteraceae bacterium]|nr:class I SAM-dependent methyltransferase [Paracoccaceae bacterium]